MTPRIANWDSPPQMDTGAPAPCLFATSEGDLYCAYFVNDAHEDLKLGRVAAVRFRVVLQHRFGYPNDEVLHAHPLYKHGLQHYGFYVVEDSPLIAEIEEQNRIHPRHKAGMYAKRFKHFVITFHDETLEVVAKEGALAGRSDLAPDGAVVELARREGG